MKDLVIKLLLIIFVGLIFMDTPSNKQNRLIIRYNSAQVTDLIPFIKHMSRPVPTYKTKN
jgi:hypothetical protein